jgi:hypothetical protein
LRSPTSTRLPFSPSPSKPPRSTEHQLSQRAAKAHDLNWKVDFAKRGPEH